MTGALVAGAVEIEVGATEVVPVELEAAGLEVGIVEDEAGTFELLGPPGVVLLSVVVPRVMTLDLQAAVMAMDVISAPAAAAPVCFKNCRLENLATRKIFRLSRVSFPSFSRIHILLKIVLSHEKLKIKMRPARYYFSHRDISRRLAGFKYALSLLEVFLHDVVERPCHLNHLLFGY